MQAVNERDGTPILYTHGADDQAVPVRVPHQMASLTASVVVVIDGAGHLAQQEQPTQVTDAIRAFTKKRDPLPQSNAS